MGLKIKFIVATIILTFWVTPAYAYLDPSLGSAIVHGILAAIATGIATISVYWSKIKAFFSKSKNTPKDK
jgi:hypothetical protein